MGLAHAAGAKRAPMSRRPMRGELRESLCLNCGRGVAPQGRLRPGEVTPALAPGDPATFAAAVGRALLTAFAGTVVPAWRAVRLTPMSVLRAE